MKKQHSKLRLAKKVISTLKTNSIKGGTNTGGGLRTSAFSGDGTDTGE